MKSKTWEESKPNHDWTVKYWFSKKQIWIANFFNTNRIDVLLFSETKIDETFPIEQFLISGFAEPLRVDRNSRGG